MLLILIFLLLSGLFSGAEIALISADRIRLHHLEREGSRLAKSALDFLAKPEGFLPTILVGNNLANVATTVLATSVFLPQFGRTGMILLPFLITIIILLFGEILPKVLLRKWADRATLFLLRPLQVAYYLFFPFIFLVNQASRGVLALLSLTPPENSPLVTRGSFEIALRESVVQGIIHPREGRTISSIFSYSQMEAKDVMVQKEKIFALPLSSSREQILEEVSRRGFERVPIFDSSLTPSSAEKESKPSIELNGVAGILHVTDLFKVGWEGGKKPLKEILQPARFVPERTRFHDLLTILREDVNHLALVQDDKKRIMGLVTLDDILKELFGEIREETSKK
jgi:putative hemolysin